MPVSAATYERVALEDPDGKWELVCGQLRRKPAMTTEHQDVARNLVALLVPQLDRRRYRVDKDGPKLRISTGTYYLPDVCVIPAELIRRLLERPGSFEVYDAPMPLVAEVWSPSTGDYDVGEKLREYQLRQDREIWRIHPYERTLTAWQLQPDGRYSEATYATGVVRPAALPGVAIALADLFE